MNLLFSPRSAVPSVAPERNAGNLDLAVDRRRNLSAAEFRHDYLKLNRPVVIEDALAGWPALGHWTPEFFAERFPEKIVTFRDGSTLPMREFIAQVQASNAEHPAPYWTNAPLREHFPELMADIDPALGYLRPNWARRRFAHRGLRASLNRGAEVELYIGGAGGAFPVLHWDGLSTHAFLMQIHGVKRYWLWPPSETPFLYPDPAVPNTSPLRDVEHPDLNRYPLAAKARGGTLTLHPGELLFVPTRWWHTAKMLSPSITLSVNAVNASNWLNFSDDMTRSAHGLGRRLKTAYLTWAGVLNCLLDTLGTL